MNIIELLQRRQSNPKLDEPAPSRIELEQIMSTCMTAPDHACLKPWKYIVVSGDSRKKLGELFAQAHQQAETDVAPEMVERMKSLPMRAPAVVVAAANYTEHPKVPRVEQVASTAAGIENMLIATEALGYRGYWRTGALARNPYLKSLLGFKQEDEIVGFVYMGTAQREIPAKKAVDIHDFVEFWD